HGPPPAGGPRGRGDRRHDRPLEADRRARAARLPLRTGRPARGGPRAMRDTTAPPDWVRVNRCVEAFEAARACLGCRACREPGESRHGPAADLRDYLPERSDPLYLRVLTELVRVDMEYAWPAGNGRSAAYLERFPELRQDAAALQAVRAEE